MGLKTANGAGIVIVWEDSRGDTIIRGLFWGGYPLFGKHRRLIPRPDSAVNKSLKPDEELAQDPPLTAQEPSLHPATLMRQAGYIPDCFLEDDNGDLELESDLEELPTFIDKTKVKKNEIIEIKYPFNIEKIVPRSFKLQDSFSSVTTLGYDISLFSSAKYHLGGVGYNIKKDYPGYEFKIYAHRAIKKTRDTLITRLKLIYKFDHHKKFIHVNVELLGAHQ